MDVGRLSTTGPLLLACPILRQSAQDLFCIAAWLPKCPARCDVSVMVRPPGLDDAKAICELGELLDRPTAMQRVKDLDPVEPSARDGGDCGCFGQRVIRSARVGQYGDAAGRADCPRNLWNRWIRAGVLHSCEDPLVFLKTGHYAFSQQ